MPSLSDNQAFLLANGYMVTPGEADNIAAVLCSASANPAFPPDSDPDTVDVQFKDSFIKGGATAYDDEVRKMWADLLCSELNQPGFFSKKTLGILKSMDRGDVEAFKTLCSFSLNTRNSTRPVPVITTINGEGWSYNDNGITVDQLGALDALGLIDKNTWTTYTLNAHSSQSYQFHNGSILVSNNTDRITKFDFGNALFLPVGIELASLCEIGTADSICDLAKAATRSKGLTISVL
ncbi:MAG: DUF2806 domain-containing protein [Eggerthellales bacterium]|nr:DUF2806 domain-containing protein [Eggerthellales bacterium]